MNKESGKSSSQAKQQLPAKTPPQGKQSAAKTPSRSKQSGKAKQQPDQKSDKATPKDKKSAKSTSKVEGEEPAKCSPNNIKLSEDSATTLMQSSSESSNKLDTHEEQK